MSAPKKFPDDWSIDRRVSIAALIALVVAAASGMSAWADYGARLTVLERDATIRAEDHERLVRVEEKLDAQARLFEREFGR